MAGYNLIEAVSHALAIPKSTAKRIAETARHRYKIFKIPKKRKPEKRTVAQPAREVKLIQKEIVRLLEPKLPVHWCAKAYKKRTSIKENAEVHTDCNFLTKLDFIDFFSCISREDIFNHFQKFNSQLELDKENIDFVLNACTWNQGAIEKLSLCIGAPSSPWLSNTIMYDFDTYVVTACTSLGVNYSRYSDDISISCSEPKILIEAEKKISEIIRSIHYPRLRLNQEKRVAVGRSAAMRVTGLTLTNDGHVSVGRKRKRGVRAGVNRYVLGKLSDNEIARLKGELAFVLSVEPDFSQTLIKTYSDADLTALLPKRLDANGEASY